MRVGRHAQLVKGTASLACGRPDLAAQIYNRANSLPVPWQMWRANSAVAVGLLTSTSRTLSNRPRWTRRGDSEAVAPRKHKPFNVRDDTKSGPLLPDQRQQCV